MINIALMLQVSGGRAAAQGDDGAAFTKWLSGEIARGQRVRRDTDSSLRPAALARLILEPSSWVRRRIDRIDIQRIDEARVVSSIDVRLSASAASGISVDHGDYLLLPIGWGVKGGSLAEFSVHAEGRPASLLSRPENAFLSAHVLAAILRDFGYRQAEADSLFSDLVDLCGRDGDQAAAHERLSRWIGYSSGLAAEARMWIDTFWKKYVQYVLVPANGRASGAAVQRHIEFAETARTVRGVESQERGTESPRIDALEVTFSMSGPGNSARYHLDVGADSSLYIVRAALWAHAEGADNRREIGHASGPGRVTIHPDRTCGPRDRAEVVVRLVPHSRAWSTPAARVSRLVLASTVAMLALIAIPSADPPEGTIAIILAPLGLGLALLFRRLEAPLERDATRKLRRLLAGQLSFLVFSLGSYLVSRTADIAPTGWLVAVPFYAAIAGVLISSSLLTIAQIRFQFPKLRSRIDGASSKAEF